MKRFFFSLTSDTKTVDFGGVKILIRAAAILGFVGLIALGANAKIPLPWTAVPLTLQTLFVLLAGALLGPIDGAAAVAGYLLLGAAGAPLFALSSGATGLSYFAGVTGGYLIGFFLAAIFVGVAVRMTAKPGLQLAAVFAGAFLILAIGTIWLGFVLKVSPDKAAMAGFVPFVIGDIAKATIAFGMYRWMRGART